MTRVVYRVWFVGLVGVIASCGGDPDVSVCASGLTCPDGRVCVEAHQRCVEPAHFAACDGAVEGADCASPGGDGVCRQGLCIAYACGNRYLDPGERCDDGNTVDGDGCSSDCRSTEICGNDILDLGADEVCDCGVGEMAPGDVCPITNGPYCTDIGYSMGALSCSASCSDWYASTCRDLNWTRHHKPDGWWRLRGIHGVSRNHVIAVGDLGRIMRYDGDMWSYMPAPTWPRLTGVWLADTGQAFAVGEDGALLSHDGQAWAVDVSPTVEDLAAVWGNSPDHVVAVGDSGAIAAFDGIAWSAVPSPVTADLATVAGDGQARFVAAGRDVIVQSTGGAWSPITPPVAGVDWHGLWSVSADSFIIGGVGSGHIVIGYHDAAGWTTVTQDVPEDRSVDAMWGTGRDDIFVALYEPDGKLGRGELLHYNGVRWSLMFSEFGHRFEAIGGTSADDVFAVGVPIFHYDGAALQSDNFRDYIFSGAWGSSPSDVYAAGNDGWGSAVLYHHDGDSWSSVPGVGNFEIHYDVWGSGPDDVFVLTSPIDWNGGPVDGFVHYDGQSWTVMASPNTGHLTAVSGTGPADVFAVGENGTILRYDGASWSLMTAPTTEDLRDVWARTPTDVYAVGDVGTFLHYDGAAWTAIISPVAETLSGVWGSGPNDVYAVGERGTAIHYDGAVWTELELPTALDFTSVHGSRADDVFIVGDSGIIFHYDGAAWSPINTEMFSRYADVWVSQDGPVILPGGGFDGRIDYLDRTAWN